MNSNENFEEIIKTIRANLPRSKKGIFDKDERSLIYTLFGSLLLTLLAVFIANKFQGSPAVLMAFPLLILATLGIGYMLVTLSRLIVDLVRSLKNTDTTISRARIDFLETRNCIENLSMFQSQSLKLFSIWMEVSISAESKRSVLIATLGGFLSIFTASLIAFSTELSKAFNLPFDRFVQMFLGHPYTTSLLSVISGQLIILAFYFQTLTVRWKWYKYFADATLLYKQKPDE